MSSSETENSIYLRFYRPQGTHSHYDTRASRSIFCIHFRNFLINYMIKIIYFLPNTSKRKNNRRLYLRKRVYKTTLISCLTYFGEKNWIFSIFRIKTWNIHPVKKCLNENLETSFRQIIFHIKVFFISHIFCLKNGIFEF